MSRIDLVSKNLLANCFRNFSKKDLTSIEEIANVAKIAKVRRIFLAMWKDWVTNMAKIARIHFFKIPHLQIKRKGPEGLREVRKFRKNRKSNGNFPAK